MIPEDAPDFDERVNADREQRAREEIDARLAQAEALLREAQSWTFVSSMAGGNRNGGDLRARIGAFLAKKGSRRGTIAP